MTPRDMARPMDERAALPSLPNLGQIFSSLTSEVGGILTNGGHPATKTTPAGPAPPPPSPTDTMPKAVLTTVWETSFVTVRPTAGTAQTQTSQGTQPTTYFTTPITQPTPSTSLESTTTTSGPTIATSSQHSLTHTPQSRTTSNTLDPGSPLASKAPAASKPSATNTNVSTIDAHRKHVIIGSLSAAIAGLLLVGVLLFFFLNRRRKKNRSISDGESAREKDHPHPALANDWARNSGRHWSQALIRESPPQQHNSTPPRTGTSTPDLDGPIHVSLNAWPRPYAYNEGYRESMGPRPLQVMNPSDSRPTTPGAPGSSDSVSTFLARQKTAFAAALTGVNRSRGNSTGDSPQRNPQIPTISIDPALSNECVARNVATPSFRSYGSSVASLSMIEQRPPEDPFLTPPDERAEDEHLAAQAAASRRPGVAPLQSAAGAATRTLSHLGSVLNPFRSKSNAGESVMSTRTISSCSSGDDPFQYDQPSPEMQRGRGLEAGGKQPSWSVYEGT